MWFLGAWMGCEPGDAAGPAETTDSADTGGPIEAWEPGLTLVADGELVGDGASLDLGEVEQGGQPLGVDFVVTNHGDASIELSASLEGMAWGTSPPASLEAGDSAAFSVELGTDTEGEHSGLLTLAGLSLTLAGRINPPPVLVAVGGYGRVLVTEDYGDTIASDTWSFDGELSYTDVCWGGGRYVAVGGLSRGQVSTSEDASSWEDAYDTTQSWIDGCAYGDGTFVLVGTNGNLASGTNEGRSWVEVYNDNTERLEDVAWGDGVFIAVGNDRRAVTDDGLGWDTDELYEGSSLIAITYGDGVFVAVGRDGEVATSGDQGANWTTQYLGGCSLHGVVFTGDRFLTGCRGRNHYTSPDGLSWSEVTDDFGGYPEAFLGGYIWGIQGDNGLYRSRDGVLWDEVKAGDDGPPLTALTIGSR